MPTLVTDVLKFTVIVNGNEEEQKNEIEDIPELFDCGESYNLKGKVPFRIKED